MPRDRGRSMRILHLEDDPRDAELVHEHLASDGLEARIVRVGDRDAFERELAGGGFDLVLSDYELPAYDGRAALDRARESAPDVPFVFVSGAIGEEIAIESLKRGATDYVLKHRLERLGPAVRRALRERENLLLRRAVERERDALHEAERRARREAERVAAENRLLADASEVLASSLDLAPTLVRALRLLVPQLADWAVIDLVREDVADEQHETQRVAWAHRDPAREQLLSSRDGWQDDPLGAAEVMRTGEARVVAGADTSAGLREQLGLHLAIVVPISLRASRLGTLVLATADERRGFVERDVALAMELALRIAVAIDNARLYAQAQSDRKRAEDANRGKDEFLATVSHELRTPLNAILGWARMLREGTIGPEKQRRAIEIIERNARVQTQLIEDLLDVSRIVSGKLRLSPAPIDPASVVEMAVEAIRPQAEARGVRIAAEVPSEIGEVLGDADRLQQVVWNLLTNAVKFTPTQGRVDVRLRALPGEVEIVVRDTGAGIPREFLPHVFDRFRQADAGKARAHGGLGLGLTIVRHIVELHGGSIVADSDGEGRGATFTVRLPASVRAGTRPQVVAVARPSLAPTLREGPRLRGVRVLVVDDEMDARELLVSAFHELEASVTIAASADEALRVVRDARPHVLVSDIGMPGEDGYSLIRKVRAIEQELGMRVPAIALTAYAAIEDRTKALSEGFDRHVAKPVEPSELAVVIAELTEPIRADLDGDHSDANESTTSRSVSSGGNDSGRSLS
ncbi:response regulator [Sandaracinus amylolyticus]|uniref:histidine kinase n=1 Tax=Sandaracinus amylolyticus TaxID=927083 RepID=A0A0F6YG98_9BACT|nr:response regulator [Sandaracinus amylolyticus]AKF03653.1 Chemotaxis protein methyltransferase CheR [Sandaracinus amylolyticus]